MGLRRGGLRGSSRHGLELCLKPTDGYSALQRPPRNSIGRARGDTIGPRVQNLGGPKIAVRGGMAWAPGEGGGGGSRNGLPCRALCFV